MPVPHTARPLLAGLLASTALVGAAPALAQNLPSGGHVVSGGVSIGASSGGALAITQSSQSAIVNWRGFSIGQNNRVDIQQPNAQAAILNRVTGDTRSTIAGQLNANGQVYLVNPNGITITRTGKVNAGGGFVASSLGISDEDFKAGRRQFRGSGASASVTNRGTITIGRGGYAALIGGQVSNRGTITVPMGRVGLGSGERATLDLSGDGFLQVQVPTSGKGRGALVSNAGTISADGGSVTLTAAAARDMARQAVNLSGTVEARSVSGHNGSVTLSGGEGGVSVASTGRIDASGASAENGGRVRIAGRHLVLAGTVDVSGARGGHVALRGTDSLALSGRVLAQGNTGGGGRMTATAPAITTHAALIDASGVTGGGTVRLGGGYQGGGRLAHANTLEVDAATKIRADALGQGDGGSVVVWSDLATHFAGTITARGGARGGDGGQAEVSSHGTLAYDGSAILTAARGRFGTLLLDPYNITISLGADQTSAGLTASGTDSVINVGTLQSALNSANVTVSTGGIGSAGSQAGNITVAAPVTWSSNTLLTLSAANAIAVNATITVAGGGKLALNTATTSVNVASPQPLLSFAQGASVTFAANSNQGSQALTINTTNYTLLRSMNDVAGLNGQGGAYALAGDLVAPGPAYGAAVVGTFSGTMEGLGHTISGLSINAPSTNNVGLIGQLNSGGTVRDLGMVGGKVTGAAVVGALVGDNSGTITQAYATSNVSASLAIYATIGGLVGENDGTITRAYATGTVSARNYYVGGLVGWNRSGTITQAYATGAVSGSDDTGGLVGYNTGTVRQAYATGVVNGGVSSAGIGGLVGINGGRVIQGYWDTQTSGPSASDGIGLTTRQLQGLDPLPVSVAGSNATLFSTTTQLGDGTASAFSGGANGLYPYLTSFFPNGVQAITGTTTLAGAQVGLYANGTLLGGSTVSSGALNNGRSYVYQIVPAGTLPVPNSGIVPVGASVTPSGASNPTGLLYTDTPARSGNTFALGTITAGQRLQSTTRNSYSDLQSDLAATFGAGTLPTLNTALAAVPTAITATGGDFALDRAITAQAGYSVTATFGSITLAQSLTASGQAVTLTAANGSITQASGGTLTAATATLTGVGFDFNNATPGSITTTGALTLQSVGTLSLSHAGAGLTDGILSSSRFNVGSFVLQSDGDISVLDPTFTRTTPITLNAPGNIFFGGFGSPGAASSFAGNLILGQAQSVTQTGPLSVAGTLTSGSGVRSVALTNGGNQIATLGAFSASGGFQLANSGDLTIGGSLNMGSTGLGITNTGTITQSSGTITGGNTTINAGGSLSLSNVTTAGTTTLSAGTGVLTLGSVTTNNNTLALNASGAAGHFVFNNAISSGTAATVITSSGALTLGAAGDANATITDASLNQITASAVTLRTQASGTLTVDSPTIAASIQALTLNSAADIAFGTGHATFNQNLTLSAGTGITQGGAGAITLRNGTLSGAAGAAVSLDGGANDIAALGAFDTTAGGTMPTGYGLSIANSHYGTFNLTGAVTLGTAGVLTLTDTVGAISQTAGTITANTLTGSSNGGALFAKANGIVSLGAFFDPNSGNLSLTSVVPTLGVTGSVTLGYGSLTLLNTAGNINQTGGTIFAGTITGSSKGGASFTQANYITSLGAFSDTNNGNLSLTSNAYTLGVTGTVNIGTGTLTLTSMGGTINQNGGTITAGMLSGQSMGGASFTQANTITSLGIFSDTNRGALSLTSGVPTLGVTGTVGIGSGTLTLTNTAGTISQTGGTITAGTLTGSSNGGATFNQANVITSLGAFTDTNNSALSLTSGVATLGVTDTVNIGTGTLALTNSVGTISQTGGTITAGTLTGVSNSGASFTQANSIASLGAFTNTNNSNLNLTSGVPTLSVTGTVSIGSGTLTLTNTAGTISQTGGTITAGALTGSSNGGATFNQANAITSLGAFTDTNNSALSLTSNVATLGVTDTVNIGTGTLALTNSAGTISQTGGTITAGALTGQSKGGATFNQANAITSLGAFSDTNNGALSLSLSNDVRTFDVTGPVGIGSGTLTLVNPRGTINQTGGTITAGTLSATGLVLSLPGANRIENLTNLSSDSGINFVNAVGFALGGSVSSVSGAMNLSATSGDMTVSASLTSRNGALNLSTNSGNLTFGGSILKNTGAVSLSANFGNLTVGGNVATSYGAVSLSATSGNLTVGGNVTTSNAAVSLSATSGNITVGGNVTTTSGAVSLSATSGNLTLNPGAQVISGGGGDVTLATTGAFVNNAGGGAVSSGSGQRWLIYSATSAGDTFGGLDSSNTAVWNTAANGTVTQAGKRYVFAEQPTLTITPTNVIKTYGDDAAATVANAYNLSGIRPDVPGAYLGDTAAMALSGTPTVTSTGSAGTAPVSGSPYAITVNVSGLTSPAGYLIRAATNTLGGLTVGQRAVTVIADPKSRVYGDANPALTYTVGGRGLATGDGLTGGLATAADPTTGVGTAPITQGTLTGAANPNYAITYQGANLTVTARPQTITGGTISRLYGAPNPASTTGFTAQAGSTGSGGGLVNGDTIGSVTIASATADATTGIGNYRFTPGSATFSAGLAGNYLIGYVPGTLTVTPAPLTITANDRSKVYGTSLALGTTGFTTAGLINSDGVTGVTLTSLGAAGTAGVAGGPYPITPSAAQGTGLGNYTISYVQAQTGLTVTPAPVTVTALGGSSTYGAAPANPGLSAAGLQNGEGISVLGLSNNFGINPTTNAGTYVTGVAGTLGNANYTLAGTVNGSWTVAPRPLTITADAQSRIYGDANPVLTYTVGGSGLVNGDGIMGSLATTAGPTSAVGGYAITEGALTGSANPNYAITYQGATLTVAARPITVAADAQSRVYGDANPAPTYTVGGRGLVNGDAVTGALATLADPTSNVGANAITQGSLAASGNYAVSYQGANLSIAARPITVIADPQRRVYGDGNPALTYTIGGRGLANGDTFSGGLATSASMASGVGDYAITQGSLTAGSNYALGYAGANLTVTPRPLTIVVDPQSIRFGMPMPMPMLTYTIDGRGLVNGDTLTGTLTGADGVGSRIGSYPIGLGTLAASANYSLTLLGADLLVTPMPSDASALAGTVERSFRINAVPSETGPEIVRDSGTNGGLLIVDPRFDRSVVCLPGGSCYVVPRKVGLPMPASSAPPRPQASAGRPAVSP